jgi:hypothetical protein
MKTQDLDLVSSPDQAGLKTLEKPRFLTPASKVMTPPIPTPRESTTQEIRTSVGMTSTSPVPQLRHMRNHHDMPQPTASWTAVALYRFSIYRSPLTLPKAHPQTSMILCVFAPLREAFLSPLQWSLDFLGPSDLEIGPSYRLNGRLYLQKYIFSKPATHNPLHTLKP